MRLDILRLSGDGQQVSARGRLFFPAILAALTVLILAGCGSTAPRAIFTPIRPDPTPTGPAGGSQALSRPTSVVPGQVARSSYTHPTGRFSIAYPESWQPYEQPDGVIFIDPGSHAGYSVTFTEVEQTYSDQELNQYLVSFVAKNFAGAGTNFKAISQEQKTDGVVVAQFSSRDPFLGQAISEVRVQQKDNVIFVLLINAVEEQWDVSQQGLQQLLDTFVFLETGPAAAATPTEELPAWTLIGPTSNKFGFLYSDAWEILNQDETSVAVGMASTDVTFEAKVVDLPEATEDAAAAALAYVDSLTGEYENVQHLPPQEFPLDRLTGSTIDFLYTDKDGTDMAGSIITAVQAGELYQVIFLSPAETYQAALEWFNPMYKSFKILPQDQIATPEP